ncbi:hypothetical protein [Micromonospora aurantiaca (nom. illeg.)]|uniref:hypothetical protein n=1 Tax=Micromonospora aurantiaca (nom. illeg.) TaxID=47850 RepID=UPI003EBFB970
MQLVTQTGGGAGDSQGGLLAPDVVARACCQVPDHSLVKCVTLSIVDSAAATPASISSAGVGKLSELQYGPRRPFVPSVVLGMPRARR